MKAAVLHRYDETLSSNNFVQYEDVPDPKIERPTDVIVRIGGAGVCRTDLHVVEGIWRSKVDIELPYIMGHERRLGRGRGLRGDRREGRRRRHLPSAGDQRPLPGLPSRHRHARRGKQLPRHQRRRRLCRVPAHSRALADQAAEDARAEGRRALHRCRPDRLPRGEEGVAPSVAGECAVVIGAGGLGHIGIQVLAALCAAEIIIVDRSDAALQLAKECGAHHLVKADGNEVERVLELTKGKGAEAVIDFVGEGDAIAKGLAMTRNAGSYYIVGYGGKIDIPTIDMITSEKSIIGNLAGNVPRAGRADGTCRPRTRAPADPRIQAQGCQPGVARSAPRQGAWPRRADPVSRQP